MAHLRLATCRRRRERDVVHTPLPILRPPFAPTCVRTTISIVAAGAAQVPNIVSVALTMNRPSSLYLSPSLPSTILFTLMGVCICLRHSDTESSLSSLSLPLLPSPLIPFLSLSHSLFQFVCVPAEFLSLARLCAHSFALRVHSLGRPCTAVYGRIDRVVSLSTFHA